MSEKKQIALYASIYALARILSFATYKNDITNQIIAGIILSVFIYFCVKNIKIGWVVLVGELVLDGAGHFFELNYLLLRTWFLGIFGIAWIIHKIREKNKLKIPEWRIFIAQIIFLAYVFFAAINGFLNNHLTKNVLQDGILYFFILLLYPALDFTDYTKNIFVKFIKSWVYGSVIFLLSTLTIYSSGFGHLPDRYYHWFRNIAAGKITDLTQNFFRVVLPDHLFVVPIILVATAFLMHNPKNKTLWILNICSVLILSLNFTRIYWLGLIVGLAILAIKQPIKKYLTISAIVLSLVPIIFVSTHFIASRGQSFGLAQLGLRLNGMTAPQTDISGAIRLLMLPDIFKTIKKHPIIGNGLGATVTYLDPITHENVTRTQFDWGYLEMLAELGVIGTIFFFSFFILVLYNIAKKAYAHNEAYLEKGLFASGVALSAVNITTPALLQGYGMLFLVIILVVLKKHG
jgi:O-antigen ligase